MPECGTHSGYKTHRAKGEEACATCKEAMRRYTSERRERLGPERVTLERRGTVARHRALERLRQLHPTLFRLLVDEERMKLGLAPVRDRALRRAGPRTGKVFTQEEKIAFRKAWDELVMAKERK